MKTTVAALSLLVVLGTSTPASAAIGDVLWAIFDLTWAVPPDLRWDDPATTVHATGRIPLNAGPREFEVTGDPHVPRNDGWVTVPTSLPELKWQLEGPWSCRSFDNPPHPGCRPGEYRGPGYNEITVVWPGTSVPADRLPIGEYSTERDSLCLYNAAGGCREATLIEGHQSIISTPEAAILPRLSRHILFGSFIAEPLRPIHAVLQRATAALAARLLGAPRQGVQITLPAGLTLEVNRACSGERLAMILIGLAILIVAAMPHCPLWRKALLIVLMVPLAVEANALRVAGIGMWMQHIGPDATEGLGRFFHAHDWIANVAVGLAIAQLVGLARVLSVSRRGLPRSDRPRGRAHLTA